MEITLDPYIPEHIIDYFETISELKASLYGRYLLYHDLDTLVVIGYPLKDEYDEEELARVIREYWEKYRLRYITVIAPRLPSFFEFEDIQIDEYYRLKLPLKPLDKKLRYMISRAEKEIVVEVGKSFSREHRELVEVFLKKEDVKDYMRYICSRLDRYLAKSKTVKIITAYNKRGELVGFDILDLASSKYSFYMFNFIDRESNYIPGVSDLLLYNLLKISQESGKEYVNMGLGINDGVRRFKLKWGAEAFLPYQYGTIKHGEVSELLEFFSRL
ncbi:MAG: hypothetical protein NZ929_04490 [Aigarchaeota archaeon]|nr:hypothetical protein [Aigarchaeota archaeon]MCX8192745.1 hypothetical protein [Nitrososphaeria archaeon]MDW7985997.1 hypothetical protein [Nitrososphaerota archaeon]